MGFEQIPHVQLSRSNTVRLLTGWYSTPYFRARRRGFFPETRDGEL
jgi:hypothetical protein